MTGSSPQSSPTKRRTAVIFAAVVAVSAGLGMLGLSQWQKQTAVEEDAAPETVTATRIETIFMPLDRQTVPVPQKAEGSGGAITEWSIPVIVTQTGEFFAIEDNTARLLDITPPENNVADYLAYMASVDDRDPLDYWFRYNDIHYTEDFGGRLFLSYSQWDAGANCVRTVISYATVEATPQPIDRSDWTQLFQTEPCLSISPVGPPLHVQMAGGRLDFSADGKLLLANGDYGKDGLNDHPIAPQLDDYDYGKIIEIDVETGAARHLTKGHSNQQGIAVDNDGAIWQIEHGRRGGDELNLILPGRNYGWPLTSLGTRYNKLALPTIAENGVHSDGFEAPIYSWLPSIAPGSLALIDGFDPLWDGDLLVGSLKAQALHRIRLREGRVLFVEDINIGHRIRDIEMLSDGRIGLWTDSHSVEFLSVGQADFSFEVATRFVGEVDVSDDTRDKLRSTIDRCTQCHSLGQITADGPPALGAVFGEPFSENIAASYTGSQAKVWNTETLTAYLADPEKFAPDGAMPDPMLEEGEVLDKLVLLLSVLAFNPM